ncbi:MAG: Mrp/NBP35 family ATP-binding protein [Pseudomonadota bacterium]
MTDISDVRAALARIVDPGTGEDIVAADIVRALTVEDGAVRFVLEIDPARADEMEAVRAEAEAAITALPGITAVSAVLTAHSTPAPNLGQRQERRAPSGPVALPDVDRIVAVASGKGGVGKSTVAANLAVALAAEGKRVGLLDADVYGPSQPRMMGMKDARPGSTGDGQTIVPLQAHGVTLMSIGFMLEEGTAVVWRGPMLMSAITQMLGQVAWGALDVLIVDLPPGTGDVQLTLAQRAELSGAIIVSTPQDIALIDARKAVDMFAKTATPVLGIIENMSGFICPKCGHEVEIFGKGGAEADAARMGVPFLGRIPLDLEIRLSGDGGTPIAAQPDRPQATAFRDAARRLLEAGLI